MVTGAISSHEPKVESKFSEGVQLQDRYNRQKIIPDWDQESLSDAHVLVLGVGALGSYLSVNLALAGVGNLHLVDFDTIEISNLNRQMLFTEENLKQNKAEVAAQKLKVLNPDIEIFSYPHAMEKLPSEVVKKITVIACCLDNYEGRRWANSLAIRENIPMVTAGMYAMMGDVQTIIPYKTACFECQTLLTPDKLQQACSPVGEEREIELKPPPPLPSVSTTSSIIAGIQSQEVLKLILGIGTPISNYLTYDTLTNNFIHLPLQRKEVECPMCGSIYKSEKQTVLARRGELTKDFRYRIALSLGLAQPLIMNRGKFLNDEDPLELDEGAKVFVSDERLAKPLILILNYEKD